MTDFVSFLLKKVYNPKTILQDNIDQALDLAIKDVQFHFPTLTKQEIINRIQSNSNELAIFLYRLGNLLVHKERLDEVSQIHWLLKELCSCEIYFNTNIDVGFYIVHGQGTVVGSRNIIGKGFKIHQGCTIGHKTNQGGKGNIIGNNVTMYCNSSIIGELQIGDNVVIGAHTNVVKNIPDNTIVYSESQLKFKLI
nr:serine acetyltransferase [uncultured Flavobacterium sp.]